MRKILLGLVLASLMCGSAPAWAKKDTAKGAPRGHHQEAVVAETSTDPAYLEAVKKLKAEFTQARKSLKEKNAALATALGKAAGEFKEEEVTAGHAALGQAQQELAKLELQALLLYKKYHPDWKPKDGGQRVLAPLGGQRPKPEGGHGKKHGDHGPAPETAED
ncbi:MAG: hypothetical protein LBP55_08455 [Candidatus Adiutrix sp.]|jgi:hypothetical protein|nr:hypothetical protein [Candidatus Adiutrix sp.]